MLDVIRDKKKEADGLSSAGFTIIEVLIVLAIAGLILVVVLIAIPQLQRNQRNENRRSVAARVVTEINSYAGNNRGDIPANQTDLDDVIDRYLGCDLMDLTADCEVNINDPSSGDPMTLSNRDPAGDESPAGVTGEGTLDYSDGYICEGENLVSAENRNFALYTELEGGAIACFDNS